MRRALALAVLALLAVAAPADAATVWVQGTELRVNAAPGEANAVVVGEEFGIDGSPTLTVDDFGAPLAAGTGCTGDPLLSPRVSCQAAGVTAIEVATGDGDDSVTVTVPLAVRAFGGAGDDVLASSGGADLLDGGDGNDRLDAGEGDDTLLGGVGDDELHGGPGADRLDGDRGHDSADGAEGNDYILVRDRRSDAAFCGAGRDRVRAEVLDSLDFSCERVDYGPPGSVGSLRPVTGRGRFVPIPGQGGARIDRRVLADVLYLVRRYHVRVGDGYALYGHEPRGEHPLGLAVDLYPGAGGSWRQVDRLARWAEPRQNHPRPPFRWVGYNGDANHGRGNHLHLSWQHSLGRRGHPVRTAWTWMVRRGAASIASSPLPPPPAYPRALGLPDL